MIINKAIFGVDESYFMEFWPIQAKICKELLEIEPVLFLICDEDSDFYYDGNGLVKKIKKVTNNENGNIVHPALLACIVRMYGTKYFPDEVCLTCDLDMLMVNKDYFIKQVEKYDNDSLVIYSSDAYDLNRPEAVELFKNEPFPFTQEMYNYPYNAAKGKVFNQILDTDCTFNEFVNRHATYKPGYNFMWMIDEFYFSDCVNHKNHGVEVHKLKRGYTSPWIASRRIDRGNFPVQLEWEGEIEFQKKYGIYDIEKLKNGYYIDVNCCRPYEKYKEEIDKVVDIVLNNEKIQKNKMYDLGNKYNNDKVTYHRYDLIYPDFISHMCDKEIKMLEIGLGTNFDDTGFSRNMWKEYFPKSQVFVMDIRNEFEDEIGKVIRGDQSNTDDLKKVSDICGELDFIIDDGSHHPEHQIKSFNFLFDKNLKDGGIYIIEDIECSYWNPNETVYGYETGHLNIVDYFSKFLHELNSEFNDKNNTLNISRIVFAKNCIIIKKQIELEKKLDKRYYRFTSKL
jgi:hypothetical protein